MTTKNVKKMHGTGDRGHGTGEGVVTRDWEIYSYNIKD